MYIKKVFLSIFVFITVISLIWMTCFSSVLNRCTELDEKEIQFRIKDQKIQFCEKESWYPFEMKGVNMGTGYPGMFPNEFGISEKIYYRWFTQIADMNANVVRVYKIQSPEFYNAFYKYNKMHQKKLYLIQGVDFSDYEMYSEENIYAKKNKLFKSVFDVSDAVHGKKAIINNGSLYLYTKDVSEYLLGYMLGVEWDEIFIEYTCKLNENVTSFQGRYLQSAKDANPFEILMAQWGDEILKYEKDVWGTQPLISYGNWPDTDALINEFKFDVENKMAYQKNSESRFDVDKIKMKSSLKSGIFVSYNVYPYFPNFLQSGEYTAYMDEYGQRNPYRKYLTELVNHHQYPVVVSEFGVSTSRGKACHEIWRGIHHGGLTESEQGEKLQVLFQDIVSAGCAGSILFSWQDEWYKTTWNEKLLSNPNRRAFWSNAQSAEQSLGLLMFEPGKEKRFYPDGDCSEWENIECWKNNNLKFKMYSDEKYLHFFIDNIDWEKMDHSLQIALDTTPKSGTKSYNKHVYQRDTDYILEITKNREGTLFVQDYYDTFLFSVYGDEFGLGKEDFKNLNNKEGHDWRNKHTTSFSVVSQAARNVRDTIKRKWEKNDVGKLTFGDANPKHKEFNSNADFYCTDQFVEIRIPWQLLNFYDPSNCMIIDDFKTNNYKIQGLKIDSIHAAVYYDTEKNVDVFEEYDLKEWNQPEFHERLKKSYYTVQEMFGKEIEYDNR